MNPITTNEKLIQLIYSKIKITITPDKANSILQIMQKNDQNNPVEKTLNEISKMVILPSWITEKITINETFFFRHPEHFLHIANLVKKQTQLEIKALCLGASTGEEAYSLAMILEENLKMGTKYSISAVDIDPSCIQTAKLGLYNQQDFNRIAETWRPTFTKYTTKIKTPQGDKFQFSDVLKKKVQFSCSDVFQVALEKYDFIFIRNILIYFSEKDRIELYKKLISRLTEEGLLFIGAGELIPDPTKKIANSVSTSILKKAG